MNGFTKPTALVRNAEVGMRKLVGAHVPADPRRGFTDHMEVMSSKLVLGYKKYPTATNYPTDAMKNAAAAGAAEAATIMRKVNDEFAGILMLRSKESALMQQVLATHFHLRAGEATDLDLKSNVVNKSFGLKAIVEKDRRWVLEKIRQKMLSLSFHINTGVYLVDIDSSRRDIKSGKTFDPANASTTTEASVSAQKATTDKTTWRATSYKWHDNTLGGYRHGEIHVSLDRLKNYTPISYARIIIHEATHKYFNTDDEAYAHQGTYAGLSLSKTLNNADSYAWAAVSLYCGAVKMGSLANYDRDWSQCS